MKSQRIFRVSLHQAQLVYDIFRSCSVYTVLKDGKMLPVYDFSGNHFRSTLNALSSRGFKSPRFHCVCSAEHQSELFSPYALKCDSCYIYF